MITCYWYHVTNYNLWLVNLVGDDNSHIVLKGDTFGMVIWEPGKGYGNKTYMYNIFSYKIELQ